MEFGKIDAHELASLDLSLPPEPEQNTRILNSASKIKTSFYIGCAKWGRPDWVGTIYPEGTKDKDFLEHYARHFNSIELNATFYRMPSRKQTAAWRAKVGPDFKFCPKFVGRITHIKRLKEVQDLTDRFVEGVSGFGNNLGPVLLMPHPGMGPKTIDRLEAFLSSLPKELNVAVELRHKGWYQDADTLNNTLILLQKFNAAAVITDAAGRRDCVHMRLTTPSTFLRFVGNNLHASDYQRMDDWVARLKTWSEKGLQSAYIFMHQQDERKSPEGCQYLIERINSVIGTTLSSPRFLS